MNFFRSFWYSIYELITTKSNYRDMPYWGISFFLFTFISIIIVSILGVWICLSIVTTIPYPNFDLGFSRTILYLLLSIPLMALYFINKKIARHILKKYENEGMIEKKKRKNVFLITIIVVSVFFFGVMVWRVCLI